MKNKQSISSIVLSIALCITPANAPAQKFIDANGNKIEDSLEKTLKGNFRNYKGNAGLADVIIFYYETPSGDDLAAIRNFGGQRHYIHSRNVMIRAGLPPDKVEEYAKRDNVMLIVTNFIE